MTGAILNAIGIIVGGAAGLLARRPLATQQQVALKAILSLLTVIAGLHLAWTSLGGGFLGVIKQMFLLVIALMLGRACGRLLGLQKMSNRLGQFARSKMEKATPDRFADGFMTATVLFCVAPLGILGAVPDGLDGRWYVLGVKAVMDGLTAMAFAQMFGWGTIVSALPVLALEGTIALWVRWFAASASGPMMSATLVACGLLVFCVAALLLNLRKIEVADYLPSLFFAPLLAWLWP